MAILRFQDTDWSGGAVMDGTAHNNAWLQTIYQTIDARWSEATTALTGTQNNLSYIAANGTEADVLYCANATDLTITGLTAPASPAKPGKPLVIRSIGAGNVYLKHQNAGSIAAHRLVNIATSADTPLRAGSGAAVFQYDGTVAAPRWRLVSHEQGGWITPTFSAAAYTGPTWTVEAGDVTSMGHRLHGRTLFYRIYIVTTTVSGTPASLSIGNAAWGGFTVAGSALNKGLVNNAGGGNENAFFQVVGGAVAMTVSQVDGGTFSNATNTTSVFSSGFFEVN
jgi:hypothetical protein